MLRILFQSIQNPALLTHVTLLKKRNIIKLILLLALILGIPSAVKTFQTVQTTISNIDIVSEKMPDFKTVNQTITSLDSNQQNQAIQTDFVYYLYDVNDTVSESKLEQLTDANLVTIITKKQTISVYAFNVALGAFDTQKGDVTSNDLRGFFKTLQTSLQLSQLLIPFIVIITTLFTVILQTLLFSFGTQFFFLLKNKIVRFQHVFRVSLFASFGPYLIICILKLFGNSLPFELLLTMLYVIYVQHTVIKTILPS